MRECSLIQPIKDLLIFLPLPIPPDILKDLLIAYVFVKLSLNLES